MNFLPDKIEQSIRAHVLFHRGTRILTAVSGGLDSMVLLYLLHQLSLKNKWQLTVAHFNHQLRGRSSDADERLVKKTAANLKLGFVVERADVKKFAKANRLSIEMAARKLRHDFLARTAKKLKIKTIALAHHADDQVELFFLRLFRGAGTEGLSGMKWKSPSPADSSIQLVRPLLDQPKELLSAYAKAARIPFREDVSNVSLDFQRNRIRHELVPLLKKNYQPALDQTTLRVMEIVGAEAELVISSARDWLKSLSNFSELPIAVQRRCIQLQLLKLKQPAEFELIESLRRKPDAPISVGKDRSIFRDAKGRIHVRKIETIGFKSGQTKEVRLSATKGTILFGELKIDWSLLNKRGDVIIREPHCEFFDAGKVGEKIILRRWKSGDRFQPIGTKSATKLQNLFTNLKVPQSERHKRILATTERGEIFWVEGLRISECFKLDNQSVRRLKWKWHYP